MKLKWILLAVVVSAPFGIVRAQDAATSGTNSDIDALKKEIQSLEQKVNSLEQQKTQNQSSAQVEELDQQIRILERKREIDTEAAAVAAKTTTRLTAGANGFSISSADTNFVINLHGLVQLDSHTFFQNAAPGVDGFLLRRARPIITGTVDQDFDFNFTPDFGGSTPVIQDAFANYRYTRELQLEAGKFKVPVGLEYLQSDANLPFSERSIVSDLVPGRDLGVELHGDLFSGRASYAAGIFNGVADGANTANSDFDNDQEFAGRLFLQPLKTSDVEALQGFGFGVGGSYGTEHGATAVNKYKTDGQQTFFNYTNGVTGNGTHWRISPQAYYYYGPFGLLGEYVKSSQQVTKSAAKGTGTIDNDAWQITGSWFLTGEKNSYNSVTPLHPFSPAKGQWGAWELAARYEQLHVDGDAFPTFADPANYAKSADAWSVGLSWWLNKNVRVLTSFSRTTFSGGAKGAVTKLPEEVFFTRLQLAF